MPPRHGRRWYRAPGRHGRALPARLDRVLFWPDLGKHLEKLRREHMLRRAREAEVVLGPLCHLSFANQYQAAYVRHVCCCADDPDGATTVTGDRVCGPPMYPVRRANFQPAAVLTKVSW
jgi:hypothetical protein